MRQQVRLWAGCGLLLLSATCFPGCGGHESEDAARDAVKAQEEVRKSQAAEEAAANEELRRGEKNRSK